MKPREDDGRTPAGSEPGLYEIRVRGRLDARWSAWFDGLSIETQDNGTSSIRGVIADQAALHGLLQRVRDLGLDLIAVVRIESGSQTD